MMASSVFTVGDGHLLEHVVLRLPVEKVGTRHVLAGASGVGPERLDRDDALGVRVGERLQQDRIDHREDGDGGADAKREHRAGAQREAPAPDQAADRVADVEHERIQPSPDPRIPHLFLDLGHAAELDARLSPGFGFAQAVLHHVVDAAVQVVPQLAVEIPLQPVASPTEEIEDPRHGLFPLVEDQPDRRRQPVPARLLDRQLRATRPGERIELGLAARFRLAPLRFQPAFLFEAVQRRIQRALVDLHDLAGDLLEPSRDGVAMRGLERQDLQDQHVERALRNRKSRGWLV